MGPERKLYQKLKKNITTISWIRLENISLSGTPDLLGYNNSGHFFTVELKVTKSNKVRFSPHQIAFHVRHPNNSFICIEALGPGTVKLYEGSRIKELVACGLKLEPLCLGLDACRLRFEELGAWSLRLLARTRMHARSRRRGPEANDLIRYSTREFCFNVYHKKLF